MQFNVSKCFVLPARDNSVILQTKQDFIMEQGVPMSVAWPISVNPLHYEGFLQRPETSQNFSILNVHFKYCVRWHFCTLHM